MERKPPERLLCSRAMPEALVAAPSSPVEALLAEWGRSPGDPRLAVDPGDEMLAFLRDLHGGDAEQALCEYYRSGASIAAVLLEVLRWRFGDPRRVGSLLDFASGYGRVTRFLLDEVAADAVTASDVLPEAIAFQRRVLGVRAAPSSARVEELELPGGFDAILVTSLFTHLPEARFAPWLAALLGRLGAGGVLAFSTHELALLPPEQRPASGCCFQPHSEIAELATDDYGSTWVDEAFVRSALAATGLRVAARRFERVLCNYQDLWVVVLDPAEGFSGLALVGEPEVVVEECAVDARRLDLVGWAHARRGAVSAVEALVDGISLGVAPVATYRGDVAAARGESAGRSGWTISAALPAGASPVGSVLLLRAVDGEGRRRAIWAGRLVGAALQTRALQLREVRADLHRLRGDLVEREARAAEQIAALRHRVADVEAELAVSRHETNESRAEISRMRASRFWKLRDAWFACKRALRLTDET